jgi:hypothetical protein
MNGAAESKVVFESRPSLWSSSVRMNLRWIRLASFTAFVSTSFAFAAPIHETIYSMGSPTEDQIAQWSSLPGPTGPQGSGGRGFLFQIADPYATDLRTIAQLRGADRIQVEVSRFPNEDTVAAWSDLASKGVELISYRAFFPTDGEIERLNRSGFSKVVIVAEGYPDPDTAARMSQLKAQLSITFAPRAYPRLIDMPGLAAIPSAIPLLFALDYWPWYTHMDVLNMLPHAKRLRVVGGSFPTEESLPYLKNIHSLSDVTVELTNEPDPAEWRKFGTLPVTWSSRGITPGVDALNAYTRSAPTGSTRRLIVDNDLPLTHSERAAIESAPLTSAEWIHQ